MFERYTEHARRSIFFARYEASLYGSPSIETEHLLLGLLREDQALRARLSFEIRETVRSQVEDCVPRREQSISTSVDLPISAELNRALRYAAEESSALKHTVIDCGHLILGLLRIENSIAASVRRQNGIDYATYRDNVLELRFRPEKAREQQFQPEPEEPEASAPSLAVPFAALRSLVASSSEHLDAYSDKDASHRLKRKPWSRKEALGHLIDWATTHQQWFAIALSEPRLVATAYPRDEWVSAQQYHDYPWRDLVRLWVSINCLLIHVLERIPEEKVKTPCRIGITEPVPLETLVTRYVGYCEEIVGQILTAGKN